MTRYPAVTLKPGREKSVFARHPWLFSGAIADVPADLQSGETVLVQSHDRKPLALAAFSGASQIRLRIWTFDTGAVIDGAWFRERIGQSMERRAQLGRTACRLVHAESDGLPGLVVDRYHDVLVMQILSAGPERWRDAIVEALSDSVKPRAIVERSDAEVRALEGLATRVGIVSGALDGAVDIDEDGIRYRVDTLHGQKTGFYLDQQPARLLTRTLARDKRVLNVFCYTGGFTLATLAGGAASVLSIDSSADALAHAKEHVALNGLPQDRATFMEADAFVALRTLRDKGERFDLIILDPPKLAPTERHVPKAARAYKDINLLGFKLLAPGGEMLTFSCSGGVDDLLFQKIVAGAAEDAKVDAQIVGWLHAGEDHPVSLAFPEGAYLKGLRIRRL